MKKELNILLLLILLTNGLPSTGWAQKPGWDFGISTQYGKDYYNRKYYDQPELPPGRVTKLKSNYSWGVGAWGERHINSYLAALIELGYSEVDVPTNMLCDCNYTGSVWLQNEKHHWGSLATGVRYYINPKSSVNVFLDGRLKADWFIAATEKRDNEKMVHWNAFGYQRLVPTFSTALGLKWSRLSLIAEYSNNIARTFIREPGEYDQTMYPVKTGIIRRGISVKATFTIIKAD